MLVTYPKEIYNYAIVGPYTDLFSYTVMGLQLFVGQQVFRGVQPEFQQKGYFEQYGGLMSLIGDRLIASGWRKRNVWDKKIWKEPLKILRDIINSRDYIGDRKEYTIDQACNALLFFVGKMGDEWVKGDPRKGTYVYILYVKGDPHKGTYVYIPYVRIQPSVCAQAVVVEFLRF